MALNDFIIFPDSKFLLEMLSQKIFKNEITLQEACNMIATIEYQKGVSITYVTFYFYEEDQTNRLLITCMEKVRKKHKVYSESVSQEKPIETDSYSFFDDISVGLPLSTELDFI